MLTRAFKQQIALKMRARCVISIVLLNVFVPYILGYFEFDTDRTYLTKNAIHLVPDQF